ncbi:MAG: hypothetical protein JXQ91_07615 [Vannielia sp.]|uniref:replicative DNA helicase n=1 Tax=Vannielia sp. TaxID=2813045 RepID=UPI003B8DD4B1
MTTYSEFRADRDRPEPPSNVEAEQALLGAMLTRPDVIGKLSGKIEATHFHDPVHADIFAAIMEKHGNRQTVDLVTIRAALEHHAGLKELGGGKYLARLAGVSAASAGITDYASLIVDARCRREALGAAEGLQQDISAGVETGEAVQRLLTALSALPKPGRETTISATKATVAAIQSAYQAKQGDADLLKTGIPALDRIVGGAAPGELFLIGGVTSMGKTSLALEVTKNICVSGGFVPFVSREMDEIALTNRLISARSNVEYRKARSGDFTDREWDRWVEAGKWVADLPYRIIPKHVKRTDEVQAAIMKAVSESGLPPAAILVDYGQKLEAPGKTRFEQQTGVPTALADMAGLFQCPVICLVQLDRKIQERADPRPNLSDIKESGYWENDADQIVFCHRPEYFLQRRGPQVNQKGEITNDARADHEADLSRWKNVMQLIAAKNRHGQTMTAEVGCHMGTNRFWAAGEEQPEEMDGFV